MRGFRLCVDMGLLLWDGFWWTRMTRRFSPKRDLLRWDKERSLAYIILHAPCGVVRVAVPTAPDGKSADKTRPVEFVSVPSFATAVDVPVAVPAGLGWPQLPKGLGEVTVSIAYGGAFYA